MENAKAFSIVTVGHVDHGKSTIVGHLLAKLGSVDTEKLQRIQILCEQMGRPFEHAFVIDSLREEQRRGITMDIARIFFKTQKRSYQLLDAPGHSELIKNMVTGAARAEAALFVIDASLGLQENSRRHAFLLSFLGVRQITVLINKMDAVNFQQSYFEKLQAEVKDFFLSQKMKTHHIIPVSGRGGDNLTTRSLQMPWWQGPTVEESLDSFESAKSKRTEPLKLFIQDIYLTDKKTVIVGQVQSGQMYKDQEILLWPGKNKNRVSALYGFEKKALPHFGPNENASFTMSNECLQKDFIARGQLITEASLANDIVTGQNWRVDLFWLGKKPLLLGQSYILRQGTLKTTAVIKKIHQVVETSEFSQLTSTSEVQQNQAAQIDLVTEIPLYAHRDGDREIEQFVLVDDFEISGGGKLLTQRN